MFRRAEGEALPEKFLEQGAEGADQRIGGRDLNAVLVAAGVNTGWKGLRRRDSRPRYAVRLPAPAVALARSPSVEMAYSAREAAGA